MWKEDEDADNFDSGYNNIQEYFGLKVSAARIIIFVRSIHPIDKYTWNNYSTNIDIKW